jgi:hypothetical protein
MHGAPPPFDDAVAGGDHPQCQICVLAVGPAEAFIETTDALQRRATVGHVRRNPLCPGQAGGAAFEVGRTPVSGQWYLNSALAGAHVQRKSVQVLPQLSAPVRSGYDVIIKEDDPFGVHRAPANVAGSSRSTSTGAQHAHRGTYLGHPQCWPGGAIVDDDNRL